MVENQAPGLMTEAEKFLILSNIDRLWKEHLQALKFVQQAVGLRGYAQRDPLIEYKLEGYNLFLDMMAQIRRNVIYSIYQVCSQTCSCIVMETIYLNFKILSTLLQNFFYSTVSSVLCEV